ncbi:DegT/DnrJ/EryC1/StrS family aminotransferase [soil metagenome]
MKNIQMVDLRGQYERVRQEMDEAIRECIESTAFINGPQVRAFQEALGNYLGVKQVIPCANGTDALQIAMMALDLKPGDEVIVPCFTFVATAEVIALLGLKPVMVDVDPETFNLTAAHVRAALTPRTRAVVPVHLFGQCVDMEPLLNLAREHQLSVIEDAAQAIGADYTFSDGSVRKAGTMGTVGCTSFFPSKNLGCLGDGGALYTDNQELARKLQMIANHGQAERYYHQIVGVNSRLDSLQAAVLLVKLKRLDAYNESRRKAASFYTEAFQDIPGLTPPARHPQSTHVFHQYTLQVAKNRDGLKKYLAEQGIPSMVYYPVPLNRQEAYSREGFQPEDFPVTEKLCQTVLSLPMHTELEPEQLEYITRHVLSFMQRGG